MADVSCSILCSPDVEEKLLDRLLVMFPDEVFISTPTFGHGVAHGAMNPNEQVSGRARSLHVQIVLEVGGWQTLREILMREFVGTGIRYWIMPISEQGVCA